MRCRCLVVLVFLCSVVLASAASITPVEPKLVDGCYQIGTAQELYGFAAILNGTDGMTRDTIPTCGKLTANIIVNSNVVKDDSLYNGSEEDYIPWIPIENFKGTFNGMGYTISGLFVRDAALKGVAGFVGSVKNEDALFPVRIENLGIVDSYFESAYVGAFVGKVESTSKKLVIHNSFSSSAVKGTYVGGLIGMVDGGEVDISESYNAGVVNGWFEPCGGFVFTSHGRLTITNSYNVGTFVNNGFGFVYRVMDSLIVKNSYSFNLKNPKQPSGLAWIGEDWIDGKYSYENVFAVEPETAIGSDRNAHWVSAEQFRDGSVAKALRNYRGENVDGSRWGQNVGFDAYPVLSGEIQNMNGAPISSVKFVTYAGDTNKYYDEYVEGVELALPFTSRPNHVFYGWYEDSSFSGIPVDKISKEAKGLKTYYAKWWHYPDVVDHCYEIGDEGELFLFAEEMRKITDFVQLGKSVCVKLTADITVNSNVLVNGSLNTDAASSFVRWSGIPFSGLFDGQGHVISGLYVADSRSSNQTGLFKYVFGNTVIRNVGLKDSYFRGGEMVGSFVGEIAKGSNLLMENCFSESYVSADKYAGGLVAYGEEVTLNIFNCYKADSTVSGNLGGGLVSTAHESVVSIIGSYNRGDVYVGGSDVGGLIGNSEGKLDLVYSYNEGSVFGSRAVGGLVGETGSETHLWNSYNIGDVFGVNYIGGIMGGYYGGQLNAENDYNMASVSAIKDSVGDLIGAYRDVVQPFANSYYLNITIPEAEGFLASKDEFADGSVAKKLHDYKNADVDGSAWVQIDGVDHPVLDSEIVARYISELEKLDVGETGTNSSSSCSAASSSSETVPGSSSSSKKVESSSSEKAASSSSEKIDSSSSREKRVSSSSSKKAKSSSSERAISILEKPEVSLGIDVVFGNIWVTGALVGLDYTLMDLQGRVLLQGGVMQPNFVIPAPKLGTYLFRVASTTKKIVIR